MSMLFSFQEIADVSDYSGDVIVISDNLKKRTSKAIMGRKISSGDIIKTFKNSSCDIFFFDKETFIRLDQESQIKIIDQGYKREIYLEKGSLYFHTYEKDTTLQYLYSRHGQLILRDSKFWLSINNSKYDKVFTFGELLEISNKYSGKRLTTNAHNVISIEKDNIVVGDQNLLSSEYNPDIPNYVYSQFLQTSNADIVDKDLEILFSDNSISFLDDTTSIVLNDLIPNYISDKENGDLKQLIIKNKFK